MPLLTVSSFDLQSSFHRSCLPHRPILCSAVIVVIVFDWYGHLSISASFLLPKFKHDGTSLEQTGWPMAPFPPCAPWEGRQVPLSSRHLPLAETDFVEVIGVSALPSLQVLSLFMKTIFQIT